MKKLKQSLAAAFGLLLLTFAIGISIQPSVRAQIADKLKSSVIAVLVVNSPSEPVPVTGTVELASPNTALVFQALDVSFAGLEGLGNIDVSSYGQIRVVVENNDFSVDLVVHLIENGVEVGVLGVIEVPGCDGGGGCVGTRSVTQVFDVPGRTIRFSTLADPRATGSVHIYGR